MDAESLFKKISNGSRSERQQAIEICGEAYCAKEPTRAEEELRKSTSDFKQSALSHPLKGNKKADLWFKTVEMLLDELKTGRSVVQIHCMLSDLVWVASSRDNESWSKAWAAQRQNLIEIMNKNRN